MTEIESSKNLEVESCEILYIFITKGQSSLTMVKISKESKDAVSKGNSAVANKYR